MSNWELKENSQGLLTLEIKGDDWTKALDESFKKNVKEVNVDGFRKGAVPRAIFEQKFGKESLYNDAIDFGLNEAYVKGLEEHSIEPVAYPEISLKDITEEGAVIECVITVKPEVTLGEYKGLEVESIKVEATDEEIGQELAALTQEFAEMIVKDGEVADGDTAVIDFEGFIGEEPFEGGKGENHPLVIGSNSFIPGFEEQLVGLKAGESKDVKVTFPTEYHAENLAGQEATFKCTVHEVKFKEVPAVDDEFVKDLDREGINTVEELKASLAEQIVKTKESQNESMIFDNLVKLAAANATMEVPQPMVDTEVDRMVQEYGQQFQMQGLSLDQYYQMTGTTEEDLKATMVDNAKLRVEGNLVLEAIIAKEDLAATDADAEAEMADLAARYGMPAEQIAPMLGGVEAVKENLKARKALEFLKENAKITVK
jgi:trigger factor